MLVSSRSINKYDSVRARANERPSALQPLENEALQLLPNREIENDQGSRAKREGRERERALARGINL